MSVTEKQIIRELWETGHFWNPDLMNAVEITESDLETLRLTDRPVREALESFQKFDIYRYAQHVLMEFHRGNPVVDGIAGPATMAMMEDKGGRCRVPDFAPPVGMNVDFGDPWVNEVVSRMQSSNWHSNVLESGSGQWKGCHGVGPDAHCAIAMCDMSKQPDFLKNDGLYLEVLRAVQKAKAEYGMLWRYVDGNGRDLLSGEDLSNERVDVNFSFEDLSGSTIGLAILGNGEVCGSQAIWRRIDYGFRGGNTRSEVINQHFSLEAYEGLHNEGRNHTSGGIMNPSIIFGLPMTMRGDTSESWYRSRYGGIPVAIPGDPHTPNPPPEDDLATKVESQRIEILIMKAWMEYLTREVNKIKDR